MADAQSFEDAMTRARALHVDGGTCPGAALERSLGMMLANDLIERPYKVAVLITDGVFYDHKRPSQASKGLAHRTYRSTTQIVISKLSTKLTFYSCKNSWGTYIRGWYCHCKERRQPWFETKGNSHAEVAAQSFR